MKLLSLVLIALSVSACGMFGALPRPNFDEMQKADYGSEPHRYLDRIKARLGAVLDSPSSLRVACADPAKGWVADSPTQYHYGWLVTCKASSMHVLGLAIDESQIVYLFKDNVLVQSLNWEDSMFDGKRHGLARDTAVKSNDWPRI